MIGEERVQLIAALTEQLPEATVYNHVPEEIVAPAVVVTPAEDYLTESDSFAPGEYVMALEVHVLVDLVDNEAAAEELDQLLAGVLARIGLWSLNHTSKPQPVHTSSWLLHGVRLDLSTETTL